MLFLVTRPARERDCPPRTGNEEPRHPRTMGPSPLPVMLAEPTGPGAAGKVPGRMDSHGGHRTGSVPSGAAGATKPLPSGLYRIARIAKFRPEGGKEGPEKAWRPCFSRLRASSVDILLWVRPLLLGIPFPEALHPDSVRRARKLGHIRKLPQMPAPAEPIGSRHRPQDLQCGRCDAAKGSYSRLASLRNGHHRRPATPVSTRPPEAGQLLERPDLLPCRRQLGLRRWTSIDGVGHRVRRWIAQAPGPTPWPGPLGPRAQSPTPPAVSSGRGSRTGEGVPPSVNYKLEMAKRLESGRRTAGKTAEKPPGKAPFLGNFCQSQ